MRKNLQLMLIAALWLVSCQTVSPSRPATPGPAEVSPEPAQPSPAATPERSGVSAATPTFLPPQTPPAGAANEFKTDFSKSTVPFDDILSGGPSKDGIPPIDQPAFVNVGEADAWLKPMEPVVHVQVGNDARAYPIQVLMWHEIVNDVVGGMPVVVTFCPLCNTAIAFERALEGRVLDFGTTGRLRYSNLIMYDRQTESWWQQASGRAIVGEMAGRELVFHPATIIAWAQFKANFPAGSVLSRETGYQRNYGANPYVGYDDVNKPPFLYQGPATPDQLKPMVRVLAVERNGDAIAFPYEVLQRVRVVNASVGGQPIVVLWQAETASALDAGTVAGGRDVGSAVAYARELNGITLTFVVDQNRIVDQETGSEWSMFGRAISGRLAGESLNRVVAINHFWFSWAVFKPNTRVYQSEN